MPRVLLINSLGTTVARAQALPGFSVRSGHFGHSIARAGDPRDWEIILLVDRDAGDADSSPTMQVSNAWLSEAECPVVALGGDSFGLNGRVAWAPPSGSHRFEVRGNEPRFDHLRAVLEDSELFEPGHLAVSRGAGHQPRPPLQEAPGTDILARDSYGCPVAAIRRETVGPRLLLPRPLNRAAEATIIERLLTRELIKLFPYAYWDSYVPRRVRQLESKRAEILRARTTELQQLDEEIAREHHYFAPYRLLPVLRDDALKEPVIKALELFHFSQVRDLDTDEEKGSLDADISAVFDGKLGYLETRGVGTRNCKIDDLERFQRTVDKASARYGPAEFKLLVFNGELNRRPEDRSATFSRDVIEEAAILNMGLVTGADLLSAVESVRANELDAANVAAKLCEPGLIVFPASGH